MSLDVCITVICKLWGHCGGAHHERSCGCLKGNVQLSLSCAHEVCKCESPDDDCWNPSRLRQGGIWCVTNQSSEEQGLSWTNLYFLAILIRDLHCRKVLICCLLPQGPFPFFIQEVVDLQLIDYLESWAFWLWSLCFTSNWTACIVLHQYFLLWSGLCSTLLFFPLVSPIWIDRVFVAGVWICAVLE
jgi:hypothetical protein